MATTLGYLIEYTIIVYHRKTTAALYHTLDDHARSYTGTITIKPGGYAKWKQTHASIVSWNV